jgi:glyoxylase-like metal-dependent hydrolase (beta-lactamase superfamily II)
VGPADNRTPEPQYVLGGGDDRAYRDPLCTSVVIRTGTRTIVVDSSLPPEEMAPLLDRRTGLSIPEVDTVFLTHFHGDHRFGIDAFPEADWLMAGEEISAWRDEPSQNDDDRRVLESLRTARGEGLRVVVAGDAAMTRDFFRAREYYFNTADPEAAVRSIEEIAASADVDVPGHDNYVLNRR